jgi:hypothetical protein
LPGFDQLAINAQFDLVGHAMHLTIAAQCLPNGFREERSRGAEADRDRFQELVADGSGDLAKGGATGKVSKISIFVEMFSFCFWDRPLIVLKGMQTM